MKIYLNSITGVQDAIISMFMSKRSWTPELNEIIITTCNRVFNRNGFWYEAVDAQDLSVVNNWLEKLFKFGRKHITMLRYIDISVTVEGLHRGAQDDFDSHAKRLDNRIIRSSTRLARFENEKSDYYQGKILTTDEACNYLNIDLPNSIIVNDKKYLKVINGYVLEENLNDKDILRGLYMLSIPSNNIFKCNLTEWSHIVKERDINSNANPELKEMIELTLADIQKIFKQYTREYCYSIVN